MSFGSRLRTRREELGLKQSDLGKLLGVTGSAIGNYENGISSPKADILYRAFDVLQCDANYLFQDEMKDLETDDFTVPEIKIIKKYRTLDEHGREIVDIVLEKECDRMEKLKAQVVPFEPDNIIQMPMPLQAASAGTGELADDETVEHIPVLRNIITTKADYAMRVHGDSMEPNIHDGDLLLVRAQPAVEIGETGVFIRDNERYVKIYRENYLESINPNYGPVPLEEYSRCIGKVIGVLDPQWIAK